MVGCCMSIYDIWHGHVHQNYSMEEACLSHSADILHEILHLHLVVA